MDGCPITTISRTYDVCTYVTYYIVYVQFHAKTTEQFRMFFLSLVVFIPEAQYRGPIELHMA